MATQETVTTTVKLELDGFTLTAEGILDEPSNWTFTHTSPVRVTSHIARKYYWDTDEVLEDLWADANAIYRKYSNIVIEETKEQIEIEDE